MSIKSFETLIALILSYLDAGFNTFNQPITGEEKLVLAIRYAQNSLVNTLICTVNRGTEIFLSPQPCLDTWAGAAGGS